MAGIRLHGTRAIRPASTSATPVRDSGRLRRVLIAVGLAMFLVDLDFFALNLALPEMARDLGVSTTDMQWAISGYMLTGGAFLIPGGRLGDILGRRRTLIAGIAVFGIASALGGAAPSAGVLIACRALQGIGAAILFPLTLAVVTNAFPEERRKRAIGNLYGLAAIGTALGPFVGGAFAQHLGWRWVLFFNVPFCVAAVVLAVTSIEESRDETAPRKIDLLGLAAVVIGIGTFTFAVDRGDAWGWNSAATLGMFAAGLAALGAFVGIERRVRWPLVDLSLFRNIPYVVITLAGLAANAAFCVATLGTTIYLQQARGLEPLESGLVFLAPSGALAIAGPLAGRLGERFGGASLMAASIGAGAAGLLVVSLDTEWGVYVPALALMGFGLGIAWAYAGAGTQAVVRPEVAGEASGVTLTIVVGLAGMAVAIAATAFELVQAGGASLETAIEGVLRVVAIGALVVAAVLGVFGARFEPKQRGA